jgi:predicted secreted protein with PEFG-CTERM motif
MNSYGLTVLIAIMAAAGTLAVVPTYASSFDEMACPGCGGDDYYETANLARFSDVPVLVWTDQEVYDHESEIVVSGSVANLRPDTPITVTVFSPQKNLVTVRQVEVSEDSTYETTFSTSGALFKENGVYTIRAQYGSEQIWNRVNVEITGEIVEEEGVSCGQDELTVKGGSQVFCVPYDATGAVVTKATVSSATTSLVLMIDAESDGSISLMIPREVLDSTSDEGDSDFIVLVDGEEADFEEIENDDATRTLDITFSEGSTQIEVIGTYAVPEFGTMAAIILAVAIVSIIAVSARTRLSISPRY